MVSILNFLLTASLLPTAFSGAVSYGQNSSDSQNTEAFAERTFFYVGGQYVNTTLPGGTQDNQYMVGQIYVERLTPPNVLHEHPLVFIHGAGQTATNWLNTPDGREGWASFFLRQGYVVYLTDQPERGRSTWTPGSGQLILSSTKTATSYFTAPEKLDPLPYPQAANHTQWPGTGLPGDPAFDSFFSSQVAYQGNNTITAHLSNHSYVALADHIATPHILITHSQAGLMGYQLANERPDLLAGLVSVEPGARPFESWTGPPYAPGYSLSFPPLEYGITPLPLVFDPPLPADDPGALVGETHPATSPNLAPCILQVEPARKLPNLAKVPMLQMVGESSFQSVYSGCVASFLLQAGVDVEFVRLEERGIRGNGHFIFLEKNSIEVAEKVVMPFLEKLERQ
ncbi:hypothetical protein KVR01_011911 [Diaporthe batatas]|uniref:uncharacterized protein n=1 Tax=Diaporthe batatas TaxID=748121 RepID=UPI001D03E951|nr:uncharacterized protein KVR01_011911 [Diaporthe batatas]KAG8158150.1 hypothetical protein KVR01_011911 [Diaporthe batatas]